MRPIVSGTNATMPNRQIRSRTAKIANDMPPPNPSIIIGVNCAMIKLANSRHITHNPVARPRRYVGKSSGITIQGIGPIEKANDMVNAMTNISVSSELPMKYEPEMHSANTHIMPVPISIRRLRPNVSIRYMPTTVATSSTPPTLAAARN